MGHVRFIFCQHAPRSQISEKILLGRLQAGGSEGSLLWWAAQFFLLMTPLSLSQKLPKKKQFSQKYIISPFLDLKKVGNCLTKIAIFDEVEKYKNLLQLAGLALWKSECKKKHFFWFSRANFLGQIHIWDNTRGTSVLAESWHKSSFLVAFYCSYSDVIRLHAGGLIPLSKVESLSPFSGRSSTFLIK